MWVPDGATGKLPVLVWIHGGGFYQGSGGDDLYDGARLARRTHAIVVSINYRLGPLGFLSQRALARELVRARRVRRRGGRAGDRALRARDAEGRAHQHRHRRDRAQLVGALWLFSRLLAEHHREKVVMLIDEYDSPIHAGYTHRYYDDVIAFFRDFLSGGLKDNEYLFKGVLTGILRVARESLFSGLNNVDVFGILRPELAPYFGFTEPEVRGPVEAVGQPELLDDIRTFYNGYLFGGEAIYNPWSVLSFLNRSQKELLAYWIDTSSKRPRARAAPHQPDGVPADLEVLLAAWIAKRWERGSPR
jgi:hypothetical protein